MGENMEGVVGINGLDCGDGVGGGFAGFLDLSRPISCCRRSTVRLIDSKPMLISRL